MTVLKNHGHIDGASNGTNLFTHTAIHAAHLLNGKHAIPAANRMGGTNMPALLTACALALARFIFPFFHLPFLPISFSTDSGLLFPDRAAPHMAHLPNC